MPAQVRVSSAFLCILEGKRRLILSALEQAQEALHGSVHPEGVQLARVSEVRVFWRQVGENWGGGR